MPLTDIIMIVLAVVLSIWGTVDPFFTERQINIFKDFAHIYAGMTFGVWVFGWVDRVWWPTGRVRTWLILGIAVSVVEISCFFVG